MLIYQINKEFEFFKFNFQSSNYYLLHKKRELFPFPIINDIHYDDFSLFFLMHYNLFGFVALGNSQMLASDKLVNLLQYSQSMIISNQNKLIIK